MGWAIDLTSADVDFKTIARFYDKPLAYVTSSGEALYEDGVVHGHRPGDALDGNAMTYWLSPGNSRPESPYALEFIEFSVNAQIDMVGIKPWGGNYTVYISVMENGNWQHGPDEQDLAYTPLGDHADYVDTYSPAIPYVVQAGIAMDTPQMFRLYRLYNAQRIRITLTNLQWTDLGPFNYRGGIRDVAAGREKSGGMTWMV